MREELGPDVPEQAGLQALDPFQLAAIRLAEEVDPGDRRAGGVVPGAEAFIARIPRDDERLPADLGIDDIALLDDEGLFTNTVPPG